MSIYENIVEIPVKMGSHRFNVTSASESELKCSELIDIVIAKCRLYGSDRLTKTYAVYESLNGVERRVSRCEDIVKLVSSNNQVEFVVRKLTRIEKQVLKQQQQSSTSSSSSDSSSKLVAKRCYRKLRRMNADETKRRELETARIEVYEDIDRDERIESGLRERIIENERVLREQSEKLVNLEESILKSIGQIKTDKPIQVRGKKMSKNFQEVPETNNNNIGVLRSLYVKLKAAQLMKKLIVTSETTTFNTSTCSRALLIESGMNSCGNSSSDENDYCSKSSRSSSTSTLESLV